MDHIQNSLHEQISMYTKSFSLADSMFGQVRYLAKQIVQVGSKQVRPT